MTDPAVFHLASRSEDGWVRVVASGELDLTAEDAIVDAVAAAMPATVVLDMTDVGFIDSSGLRAVLRATRAATAAGGRLLVDVVDAGPVDRLFALAGVGDWIERA